MACHDGDEQRQQWQRQAQYAETAAGSLAPQDRRQREDQHRDQRQPVDAEHGRALHERHGIGERIAQHVPGEAGRARGRAAIPSPTATAPSASTRVGAGSPERRCQRRRRRIEQRKTCRHQQDGKRHQDGKDLGFDQERFADPEQAGEEVAEAEPPADLGGRSRRPRVPAPVAGPGAAFDCPVHQPHQGRQREPQDGPDEERRQCEDRCGTGEQLRQRGGAIRRGPSHAPPAPLSTELPAMGLSGWDVRRRLGAPAAQVKAWRRPRRRMRCAGCEPSAS